MTIGAGLGIYGGSIVLGSLSSTLLNDGGMPSQPSVIALSDWRYVVFYSQESSGSAFEVNNSIRAITISDWTSLAGASPVTLYTPPVNYTALIIGARVLSDGTIVLSFQEQPNDGSGINLTNTKNYVMKAPMPARGQAPSFGAPILVATGSPLGGAGIYLSGAVVELASSVNDLMQMAYGGSSTFGLSAYYSHDKGDTWGELTTIFAPDGTHTQEWDESCGIVIPSGHPAGNAGRLYVMVRHDKPEAGPAGESLIYTDDVAGKTGFSAEEIVISETTPSNSLGRPNLLLHPSGALVYCGRTHTATTAFAVSYPDANGVLGRTWTGKTKFGADNLQNWYGDLATLPDHSILMVIAQQITASPRTIKLLAQQLNLSAP